MNPYRHLLAIADRVEIIQGLEQPRTDALLQPRQRLPRHHQHAALLEALVERLAAARQAVRLAAFSDALRHLQPLLTFQPDHAEGLRLRAESRRANAHLFGGHWQNVPATAASMGMATILRARAIILVATGSAKRISHGVVSVVSSPAACQVVPLVSLPCSSSSTSVMPCRVRW